MPQKTSPFLEGKWGWNFGESGWNTGADENWLKFSYMFDANVNAIVSTLPPAVNGEAYFLTTDNRIYFVVDGTHYSTPVPKWFEFKVKSTGDIYRFDGSTTALVPSAQSLELRVGVLESDFDSLADESDPLKGGSLIARVWQAADSIAQLRTLKTDGPSKYVELSGRSGKGDGGDSLWYVPDSFVGLVEGQLCIQADDGGFFVMNHNGIVSARQGGLVCDGVTDDGDAWVKLATELAALDPDIGGCIQIGPYDRIRVKTNRVIPANIYHQGFSSAGSSLGNLSAADILQSGGSVLVDPGVTLEVKGANRFFNVAFLNPNLTGNQPNSSAFSGTAITIGGDDVLFFGCAFMGYNSAIVSDGWARLTVDTCKFDCNNGIDIRNSFDVPRILNSHFWPWLTVATGNVGVGTANALYRSGKAMYLNNAAWPTIDNVFTFGYQTGLELVDCTNPTVVADLEGNRDSANSIIPTVGCKVSGTTGNGSFTLDTAHHQYGLHIAVNTGVHNRVSDGMYRDSSGAGMYIQTGDATVDNNTTQGLSTGVGGTGVLVASTAGVVVIPTHRTSAESEGVRIENTLTSVTQVFPSGTTTPVNTTVQQFQIVAATTLPIRAHNDHWYVTGTTSITNFLETFSGHRITIVFTQALTLTDGAGAGAIRVGGSLSVTAGQTLQFVCNGITGSMTWRRIV